MRLLVGTSKRQIEKQRKKKESKRKGSRGLKQIVQVSTRQERDA